MRWYVQALRKYVDFNGRARRMEYWMFTLFNFLIVVALGVIEAALNIAPETNRSVLGSIYQLAVFLPSIAVAIRRMHDTDHSGWWLLVPIVNFVFAVREGTRGDNRFGQDPKATATA